MAYERSKFGDGGEAGTGNVVSTVHSHFGARYVGGGKGEQPRTGSVTEVVINFDEDQIPDFNPKVPAGAVVLEVLALGITGTITAATAGADDISAADGAALNYVTTALGGDLVVTGPTAGQVMVRYSKVA